MKEFKAGDKVTCLIYGKGVVNNVEYSKTYPVFVNFKARSNNYTMSGKDSIYSDITFLYHGHGSLKIEFVEDKEPEYAYQWLIKRNVDNVYFVTQMRTQKEIELHFHNYTVIRAIEETKQEVSK